MVVAGPKVARLVIEPRIYRAAFIPALFAVVIVMFALQSRPVAVPQALAADVLFDGRVALAGANQLAQAQPDRRPGTSGDKLAAASVAATLRAQRFAVTVDRFNDEGHNLVNVVGRRIGESTRQLVVVAPRDADRVPDVARSAADTAALLEIARTIEGRAANKTLVLASVDGSTLGAAGARRLAGQLASAGPVEAVIVLSNIGVATAPGSLLVPWSNTTARGGLALQRTLGESARLELQSGGAGRSPGTGAQFTRLAFPLGIGDQAPLLDEGFNTVRLSGSGELPPKGQPQANADRIGSLGRATLRTLFAYDAAGPITEQPSSFLLVGQNVLPRWSVALLVATLLLPVLVASIDSLARVRRRREPVTPWLRWIGAAVVPFLVALVLGDFLAFVGQAPDAPPVPPVPGEYRFDGSAIVTLSLCTLAFAAAWVFLRPRLVGELPPRSAPGAAGALAPALAAVGVAVWIVNPFAALALLPALHLWLLVTASPVRARRPVGVALGLVGALVPLVIAVAVLTRLSLGPLHGVWYGFLLVTGHDVGLYTSLVGAVTLVCFGAALRIALARRRPEAPAADDTPSVRGPGGYAGPGSLGGTESALPW
jgi:hypothetical protein